MVDSGPALTPKPNRGLIWSGRVLAGLVAAVFGLSGIMKFSGGPEVTEGLAHLGLPESMLVPLAILELACLALYLVPQTAVLGAVLLTGYLGGAICTHWRVGDVFYTQIVIGVLLWLGIYLREPRLWSLLPIRRRSGLD